MAEDADNVDEQAERADAAPLPARAWLTWPFCVTLAALTIYFGFQTFHSFKERGNLALVKASQEAAIQEAQKVQSQFKSLVTKISDLADKGHAGAKMVMEELLQRGVSATPQTTPPATKAPGNGETKPTK